MIYDVVIIGGGAAGIFAAITAAEKKVLVLEQFQQLLSKVKVSGGGRCNVTHACFDPKILVQNYPRGHKELLGPFTRFQPKDMIAWLEQHGVKLKVEADGRMFPTTDNSQTIIDCLLNAAKSAEIRCGAKVISARKESNFIIQLKSGELIQTRNLMLATGSNSLGYELAQSFGHTIIDPVPSLFTFNVPNSPITHLAGVSVQDAVVTLPEFKRSYRGPVLITHWGFSGPAVLKLSAWCARELHECNYKAVCKIDWIPNHSLEEVNAQLQKSSSKLVANEPLFQLPKNLWKTFVNPETRWNQLSKGMRDQLIQSLKNSEFQISGKTTYKEEFVTCGGVKLSEVNFKTMESQLVSGLFFGGEILDIDGITGGFNFQAAWTTGWIAGFSIY